MSDQDSNWKKWLAVAVGILTLVYLTATSLVALPAIGNFLMTPTRMNEYEMFKKEAERKFVAYEQSLKDQGKEIAGINSRIDKLDAGINARIDKLESSVNDGNRRTEDSLRVMSQEISGVTASARSIERTVQSALEIATKSDATSKNAIVRADQALEEAEDARKTSIK